MSTFWFCRHDMGWWAGTDRVRHCIGCNAPLGAAPDVATVKLASHPRPNLRLIKGGGGKENDVHDRDRPGGAA